MECYCCVWNTEIDAYRQIVFMEKRSIDHKVHFYLNAFTCRNFIILVVSMIVIINMTIKSIHIQRNVLF